MTVLDRVATFYVPPLWGFFAIRLAPTELAPLSSYVSTGQLPRLELVRALVDDAYERFRANTEGETSRVYPASRDAPPDRFGIAVAGTSGALHTVGNAGDEFAIMSVSKPFVFALVCDVLGPQTMRSHVGANATGLPFNSLEAIERSEDGRTNPMVNPGAIATTSRVPGPDPDVAWSFVARRASPASPGGAWGSTRRSTARRPRRTSGTGSSLALLDARDRLGSDPIEAVELYTRQCCLSVTALDLAVMGATLADGGVNPLTREQVVSARPVDTRSR